LLAGRTQPYTGIHELRAAGVSDAALERLADADALRSIRLDRRQALWYVSAKDTPKAMFSGQQSPDEKDENVSLPQMSTGEHVVHDYASTSLSLKAHPVSFVREQLRSLHVISTGELKHLKDGDFVKVAGLILVRQRPGTAGGVCFMTIEDETGFANLVIFQNLFETYRKEILKSALIMVEGKLQIEGEVIHVVVKRCYDFSKMLRQLSAPQDKDPQVLTLAFSDEKFIPAGKKKRTQVRENTQEKIFPGGRNFR